MEIHVISWREIQTTYVHDVIYISKISLHVTLIFQMKIILSMNISLV